MKNLFGRIPIFLLALMMAMGGMGNLLWAKGFDHISPEALQKLIENGDKSILIVDVQPKGAYDLGHIKGAINFPWAQDLQSNGNLPQDKTLILYCDCGHEEDSADVATQLKEKWGYTNMKLLQGGWSKWQQLGYPIEK